jgi:cytochrome c-type biogenesis protein CcmE
MGTVAILSSKTPGAGGVLGSNPRYLQPAEILEAGVEKDEAEVYLVGVVKPDSLKLDPLTNKHTFVVTDFIHEIKVYYEGILPTAWREGETTRVKGEFVDNYNPTTLIASYIWAAHDAEVVKTEYKPRSRDIRVTDKPVI